MRILICDQIFSVGYPFSRSHAKSDEIDRFEPPSPDSSMVNSSECLLMAKLVRCMKVSSILDSLGAR